jgi:hypothetical protein
VPHAIKTTADNPVSSDIAYGNIKVLMKPAVSGNTASYTHAHLLERCTKVRHGYVEVINGFHGYVVKATDVIGDNVWAYGQVGDGYIFKSDTGATCGRVKVGSIRLGRSGFITRPGFLQAHSTVSTSDIHIGRLYGTDNEGLLKPAADSTGFITNVRIDSLQAVNCYGAGAIVDVPDKAVDWTFGSHALINVSGGIRTQDGCALVHIGSGSVRGSQGDGYTLGGDYQHGDIEARDNAQFGVRRTTGDGLRYSRIKGSGNSLGLISSLPSALATLTNGWAQIAPVNNFKIDYDCWHCQSDWHGESFV